MMKCPLCKQSIHEGASSCPHCGRGGTELNELYENFPTELTLLNDHAGILKIKERRLIESWIQKFDKEFPNCFLSIHCIDTTDLQDVSSYGVWALNTPTYSDISAESDRGAGFCLVLDVGKKQVTLSYGYQLEPYFTPELCFNAITPAHPYLLDNSYMEAIAMMRHGIRKLVRSKSRGAKSILKRKSLLSRIVERN